MIAPREKRTYYVRSFRPQQLVDRAAKADLPDGVAGRIIGQACTYNSVDDYNTFFKPGAFDRTREEKIPAGKVHLMRDHDHRTSAHIGVVRSLDDVGNAVMMTADLFDTDEGKAAKQYLDTVMRAESTTGLSVGVYPRKMAPMPAPDGSGERALGFDEVELAEISITPFPAVDGADLLAVRRAPDAVARAQMIGLRMLLTSIPRPDALAVLAEFGYGETEPVSLTTGDTPSGTPATGDSLLVDPAMRSTWLREQWLLTEGRR